jgi:RNA polymerase sigma-70 factor (ECF subfamily)
MEYPATAHTAIEQLYRDEHQLLLRYLERLVSDCEAAEDLCHETFIKALRHWNQHDPVANVRGWLYRIASNTAYDYLRRRRCVVMTALTDEQTAMFSAPALEALFDETEPVWAALKQLPEHYRIPLLLHSWAGYPLNDIAVALGSTLTSVKMRVYRARARFRQVYIA